MIIFTILMTLFLKYKPSRLDFSQDALLVIFNYMPRITIGSLLAYIISQKCDTYIYIKLKEKYNKVWISNNGSTFISQIVDTIVFAIVSFLGIMNQTEIIQLILTMLIFKWIISLLDTPFMILATRIKNVKELE